MRHPLFQDAKNVVLVSQTARRCLDLEGKDFLAREGFALVLAATQKHDAMRTLAQLLLDNGRDVVQLYLGALDGLIVAAYSRDIHVTTIDEMRSATAPRREGGGDAPYC